MVDTTNNVNGISRTTTQTTGSTTAPKKELDQASFMKLLTMQLSYQDPFKPVDNAQMLSQMASMSTSEGISSLSTQMGKLNDQMISSQALQASSLVGQNVLLQGNTGFLDKDGPLSAVVAVGTTNKYANVKITVEDEKGQVIKEFPSKATKKVMWKLLGMVKTRPVTESLQANMSSKLVVRSMGSRKVLPHLLMPK